MSSGMACPFSFFTQPWAQYRSYIGHIRKHHFGYLPALNDLDDVKLLQQDASAVRCVPAERPGHHPRAQAQRGCCASKLVGSPSRMDLVPGRMSGLSCIIGAGPIRRDHLLNYVL